MRIYTKTGDTGITGLVGGTRLRKNILRFEAIGAVDELNAALGLCQIHAPAEPMGSMIFRVQNRLFQVGAELASPEEGKHAIRTLADTDVAELERSIDEMSGTLPPLRSFILPGGSPLAAQLHFARTICRRAERIVVSLVNEEGDRGVILVYLNRLSDWLFTAARTANHLADVQDIKWIPEES